MGADAYREAGRAGEEARPRLAVAAADTTPALEEPDEKLQPAASFHCGESTTSTAMATVYFVLSRRRGSPESARAPPLAGEVAWSPGGEKGEFC